MTFLGSELRDQTRLDSIITLIDAENFDNVVLNTEVGRAQVIYGDILLLNSATSSPRSGLRLSSSNSETSRTMRGSCDQ